MPLDAEAKRLRKLSPAALADEAGALKAKTIPVMVAAGWTEAQKRAYA